mgnify:CR=1 FL=1
MPGPGGVLLSLHSQDYSIAMQIRVTTLTPRCDKGRTETPLVPTALLVDFAENALPAALEEAEPPEHIPGNAIQAEQPEEHQRRI